VPSKDEHIKKAQGNETFAGLIKPDNQTQVDWTLVILFYAAVHYVEAYLDRYNQHLRSHTTRDKYLGKEKNLKKIFKPYSHLKYFGYNARYEMCDFKAQDTQEATKYLADLKKILLPLL
jgi:hypothetical protein